METTQHPVPSVQDIRFFLSQFRKGDFNDPKYRQGLVYMLINKIYLYDDKMTILCNTQDGHFDVDLKEVSSLKGHLALPYKKDACGLFDLKKASIYVGLRYFKNSLTKVLQKRCLKISLQEP